MTFLKMQRKMRTWVFQVSCKSFGSVGFGRDSKQCMPKLGQKPASWVFRWITLKKPITAKSSAFMMASAWSVELIRTVLGPVLLFTHVIKVEACLTPAEGRELKCPSNEYQKFLCNHSRGSGHAEGCWIQVDVGFSGLRSKLIESGLGAPKCNLRC